MTAPPGTDLDDPGAPHAVEHSDGRDAGSFRDPSGFVFWRDGQPYRQIQEAFATEWDRFEASSLKRRLLDQGRLIRYEPVSLGLAPTPGAHAVIRPERIEFLTYPYEWTFGELREAALLTLDIQLEAMAAGWTLKDASAYNIQFREAHPIHIDSASFERLEEGAAWIAYRQAISADPPTLNRNPPHCYRDAAGATPNVAPRARTAGRPASPRRPPPSPTSGDL